MNTREVQAALLSLGFDPKGVDGFAGVKTRNAVTAFQRSAGLHVDGLAGPDTWEALKRALVVARKPPVSIVPRGPVAPPWYEELLRRKGLHEVKSRSALMAWLRADGKTLGDPAKLPWCGDAIQTCLALTLPDEPQPVNPYLARNWLKFGVGLDEPALGCILVFWRGSKTGTSGHVGLYAGEDAQGYLHVLGGNQSDAITIARLDKARLLGMRWPATYPKQTTSRVLLSASGAPVSTNEA
ncbi:TIGR02594 family protein [Bosea sp. (in: a-proteobacteria)]|uniref:NlpC/P60 family protein n=1 Tax=Bosea sp. (in: a-proteobacteria) TaxID=1871050 RepID=UPI002629AC25|nr:TIGR02594 family protein [Bosea sp. (in: a-proteobacteria)]MCO5092075.1 TIGR02594 family protein [Bosea sp. (in: a-proteobacteria)]